MNDILKNNSSTVDDDTILAKTVDSQRIYNRRNDRPENYQEPGNVAVDSVEDIDVEAVYTTRNRHGLESHGA